MPKTPIGRTERAKMFAANRKHAGNKPGFNGRPVLLGSKGGITGKIMDQALERMRAKLEATTKKPEAEIRSSRRVLLRAGSEVSAMDVATRLVRRYLMRTLERSGITQTQKEIVSKMIQRRIQKIPGTHIILTAPIELIIMKLANSFGKNGYEKAKDIMGKVSARAKTLYKMTENAGSTREAFSNVYARIDSRYQLLLESPPQKLAIFIPLLLRERKNELVRLRGMNIPDKEVFIRKLETEIGQIQSNLTQYIQNNP